MTPQVFANIRAKAIASYGEGKRTKWEVLSTGTIYGGKIGAVKIRDQHGAVGLIAQQYPGAEAGMTIHPMPNDYQEAAQSAE